MDDLVSRSYDGVDLRSSYVAELVHDAVQQARDATRRATEAAAKAVEAAESGLDERTSAFVAWAAKHDVNVNERGDGLKLRLGEVDGDDHRKEVRRILREGFELWRRANRDPVIYRAGDYRYRYEEQEHDLRSIEADTVTQTVSGRVWETLE
jgi:hypothetical protein